MQGTVTSSERLDHGGSVLDEIYEIVTVNYWYRVEDKWYSGRQTWQNDFDELEPRAQYAEGRPITVYYNPHNPAESVVKLRANSGETGWLGWLIGLGLLALIGWGIAAATR